MYLLRVHISVLFNVSLSLTAYSMVTCQNQQRTTARSAVSKTFSDKKFSGANITKLSFPSATNCYLECLTTCLCAFANYKDGYGEGNCELVKFSSCDRSDQIKLVHSQGWTAMEFAKVDGEIKQCCDHNGLQKKLNDWCNANYPGTYPAYSSSQVGTKYYWRCYRLSSIQSHYYYTEGSSYFSKHTSLVGIIENDQTFKSTHYVLGGLGQNCNTVCGSYGKQCSPLYETLNAVYIFFRLSLSCTYTKTKADCFSETNPPMYYPATQKCTGFVNVFPVYNCGSYSDPEGQRLCNCIPYKFLN